MSGNAEKIVSKLGKINRLREEIVYSLINDFECLDGCYYLKKEVFQMASTYFELKRKESQSDQEKKPHLKNSIQMFLAIERWQDCRNEEKKENAVKIAKIILESSSEDLKFVPEEAKETAFEIINTLFY